MKARILFSARIPNQNRIISAARCKACWIRFSECNRFYWSRMTFKWSNILKMAFSQLPQISLMITWKCVEIFVRITFSLTLLFTEKIMRKSESTWFVLCCFAYLKLKRFAFDLEPNPHQKQHYYGTDSRSRVVLRYYRSRGPYFGWQPSIENKDTSYALRIESVVYGLQIDILYYLSIFIGNSNNISMIVTICKLCSKNRWSWIIINMYFRWCNASPAIVFMSW